MKKSETLIAALITAGTLFLTKIMLDDMILRTKKDEEIIDEKLMEILDNNKYKIKKIYDRTKKPVPVIDRKLKIRGTSYNIAVNDISSPKEEIKRSLIQYHPYIITNDIWSGNKVAMFFIESCAKYESKTLVMLLEPHLIKRYRERYLESVQPEKVTFEDLVSTFLKRNRIYFNLEYFPIFDKKDPKKLIDIRTISRMKDGVVFGRVEPTGIVRFITFINNSQVRKSDQGKYVENGYYDKMVKLFQDPELRREDIIKYF